MVTLCCAVVGEERVVTIDIGPQELVGDLEEQIKQVQEFGFPADKLKLYLAKHNGDKRGALMTTAHGDYARLSRGDAAVEATYLTADTRDAAGAIVTEGTLMDPTWSMEDYFADVPKKKVIQVLIKLPDDGSATINVPGEGSPLLGHEVARTAKHGAVIKHALPWPFLVLAILLSLAAIAEDSVGVQEEALAITKDATTLMLLVRNHRENTSTQRSVKFILFMPTFAVPVRHIVRFLSSFCEDVKHHQAYL